MPTPADLLAAARRYRGVPYAYGGKTPAALGDEVRVNATLMSLTPLATLDATWMEATRMSTPPR